MPHLPSQIRPISQTSASKAPHSAKDKPLRAIVVHRGRSKRSCRSLLLAVPYRQFVQAEGGLGGKNLWTGRTEELDRGYKIREGLRRTVAGSESGTTSRGGRLVEACVLHDQLMVMLDYNLVAYLRTALTVDESVDTPVNIAPEGSAVRTPKTWSADPEHDHTSDQERMPAVQSVLTCTEAQARAIGTHLHCLRLRCLLLE